MIDIRRITADETLIIRHKVLWPSKPLEYVRISNDKKGEHYGLYLENELIAVISVFIVNNKAQFRKFATVKEYQRMGYGSKLFEYMLKELESKDLIKIWCNARLNANNFYERYGFSVVKDSVFYKGDIGYTIMQLMIDD